MAIELIDVGQMRVGRAGGRKGSGERYPKYKVAVQKILPFLKDSIQDKGTIRVKTEDIKKELGGDFANKHATSMYWGLKYVLFQEGVWVSTGQHTDGSDVLIMRSATEKDVLPDSLTKQDKEGADVNTEVYEKEADNGGEVEEET